MSKVICDVCGTTYPETATQCPICGSAKKSTSQTAAGGSQYAYVKGGRFSKSNVRKRNKSGKAMERRPAGERSSQGDGANAILIAVVILLVVAIIAVIGYMAIRIFLNGDKPDSGAPQNPGINQPQNPDDSTQIPCTSVAFDRMSIELTEPGSAYKLDATATPANTTDKLVFTSSDESVAIVSDTGLVTAIGGGRAIITVTCGQQQAQCQVICSFGEPTEPTEPTEPSNPSNPTDPSQPDVIVPPGYELTLKYKEFTISKTYPNPVSIYVSNASVKATDITWSSDDETIATVDEKGVVTPVGKGTTTIRASFGNLTASCKVIVSFTPEVPKEYTYKLSHTDVTIKVGESFSIFLTDSEGANVKAEWTASVEGYVSIKDRVITGVKSTSDQTGRYITITATVGEEVYTCKIRVVEPTT